MRLKWLPVRLRGRRRVPRVAVVSAPARRRSTALHFCGEPANVSCARPRKAPRVGGSALLAWRAYSPASTGAPGGD